ncbi:hypothetical protein J6590_010668 [Homalodisca vitripennis]|nr:hypothetical protein J6590_010668 [Homalodisca vitripennis]
MRMVEDMLVFQGNDDVDRCWDSMLGNPLAPSDFWHLTGRTPKRRRTPVYARLPHRAIKERRSPNSVAKLGKDQKY